MMWRLLALSLLAGTAPAQELLWQVSSTVDNYGLADSIGDLNGDGWADLLTPCWVNYGIPGQYLSMRILSGADGSVLADRSTVRPGTVAVVGDFDGDGYPDYAMAWGDGIGVTNYVEVWSPRRNQQLLFLSAPAANEFGGVVAGRVDLNGDGQGDLLVGSTRPFTGDMRGYSHAGTLFYRIPAGQAVVLDVVGLADIDGDGCSEFVVGGVDYSLGYSRGYVALYSGRTGSVIRVAFDERPGELIGFPLCAVGDMDRDGTPDYATGNYWGGPRKLITVYSGASGAVIRQWSSTTNAIATRLVGGRDADLDGVVDVIGSSHSFYNGPQQDGRVQVFSSRDQQVLLYTQPQPYTSYSSYYGLSLADLGVQPGSPYPVFALWDRSAAGPSYGRIQAWRCAPAGARVTGTGCSSAAQDPTIGVRRVATPAGEQSRIVLGSAPSNAFVWCVVGSATESAFAGLSLPIALDPLGYRGCNLYVPATVSVARTVGSSGFDRGYAEVHLPRPLVPSGGYHAAAQWLVLDPATLGHAMTPRCEFRVQ